MLFVSVDKDASNDEPSTKPRGSVRSRSHILRGLRVVLTRNRAEKPGAALPDGVLKIETVVKETSKAMNQNELMETIVMTYKNGKMLWYAR